MALLKSILPVFAIKKHVRMVNEGNFLKKVSLKPSKTFINFATMLQNDLGAGPLPCF